MDSQHDRNNIFYLSRDPIGGDLIDYSAWVRKLGEISLKTDFNYFSQNQPSL